MTRPAPISRDSTASGYSQSLRCFWAQGEESEDWDDFYGSYRPRHVDTEDAREAVWATDEFESDEDNTESEWEPEYVGAGLGITPEVGGAPAAVQALSGRRSPQ
jgi:hypothetical protein